MITLVSIALGFAVILFASSKFGIKSFIATSCSVIVALVVIHLYREQTIGEIILTWLMFGVFYTIIHCFQSIKTVFLSIALSMLTFLFALVCNFSNDPQEYISVGLVVIGCIIFCGLVYCVYDNLVDEDRSKNEKDFFNKTRTHPMYDYLPHNIYHK